MKTLIAAAFVFAFTTAALANDPHAAPPADHAAVTGSTVTPTEKAPAKDAKAHGKKEKKAAH